MDRIFELIMSFVHRIGYREVFILMALESSFVPFPSEVVVPPAGYLAHEGMLNLYIVIFLGTLASVVGALVNYYIAYFFGRPFLYKYGKYFFLKEEKFAMVERFFKHHGEITMFSGRLIPVVRQYISFPAGLAGMNVFRFSFFTALGAFIWVTVLAVLGYQVGNNMELIKKNIIIITIILLILIALLTILYIVIYNRLINRMGNES